MLIDAVPFPASVSMVTAPEPLVRSSSPMRMLLAETATPALPLVVTFFSMSTRLPLLERDLSTAVPPTTPSNMTSPVPAVTVSERAVPSESIAPLK